MSRIYVDLIDLVINMTNADIMASWQQATQAYEHAHLELEQLDAAKRDADGWIVNHQDAQGLVTFHDVLRTEATLMRAYRDEAITRGLVAP